MLISRVTTISHVVAIPGFCEPVSSLSHLVAAGVALMAGVPLVRLGRGSRARVVALSIYVACVVVSLGVSGAYHSLARACVARGVMRHIDYYAIWLLIAGTFTGVHGIMCRGFWRRGLLTIIWTYAVVGVTLQILWFDVFSGVPGTLLYLGLGWTGVASIVTLGRQIGFAAVRPIWYAGIAYTAGAIVEAVGPTLVRNWIGPHEIFHAAVMVGVMLHWLFVRKLLLNHMRPLVDVVPAAAVVA